MVGVAGVWEMTRPCRPLQCMHGSGAESSAEKLPSPHLGSAATLQQARQVAHCCLPHMRLHGMQVEDVAAAAAAAAGGGTIAAAAGAAGGIELDE